MLVKVKSSMQYILNYVQSKDDKNHVWPQIFLIMAVSLGALSSCALYTWPSPSIPILITNSSHIDVLTIEEASYFTVTPPIAMIITSPLIAFITNIIGRKNMVLFITLPQLLAWVFILIGKNIYFLYVSRMLSGVSDAILFSTIPAYVGEISTPSIRGSWGNVVAIAVYFGQFLINVVGAYYDIVTTAMIFLSIPILQIILMTFAPESPYFLLKNNKQEEALNSLKILRWNANVEEELKILMNDINKQVSESSSLKDLFTVTNNRRALIVSLVIRASQQFCGIPAFSLYTQYMFAQAGGDISASTSAIVYTGVLFLMTTGSFFFVDIFGRKLLMVFSCLASGIVLFIEATYFYISDNTDIDVSSFNWLPLAGMIVYIIVCSVGLGIIPILMLGELFSASIKNTALAIINIGTATYILIVSKMFQVLTFYVGLYISFYIFSVSCLLSAVFSYFYVPETKNRTLEEIQEELRGNRRKANHCP